jgi:radical SAM protein with 4Fe4S-binding SPASM domain
LPEKDTGAANREMTTSQVKDILHQAANLGCMQIRFTGGEPLLRNDFEDLYIYTRKLGMRVSLFTNARLISSSLAALFVKIPPMEKVEITVYGMHKETYETISRASGSYSQFQQGLKLLQDNNIPYIVKFAIFKTNIQEVDEFETWANTIPWMNTKANFVMFYDLRARSIFDSKNKMIKKIRLSPVEYMSVLTRDKKSYISGKAEFAKRFMGPAGDILFQCGAGKDLCIDAYGRVQPCMLLRNPEMTAKPFSKLADSLKAFSCLSDIRSSNPVFLERCSRCFLNSFCDQCPAASWSETMTLDTPVEYLCEAVHTQARYLGWLAEDEFAWEVEDWKARILKIT